MADPTFLTTEYKALRAEILKRTEILYQVYNFTLLALGVLLTVGFTSQRPSLIFLFPILFLFAADASFSNVETIRNLGYYIKTKIEPQLNPGDNGWENFLLLRRSEIFYRWGHFGFFAGVGLLIVVGGLYFWQFFNPYEQMLIVAAGICWILTVILATLFLVIDRGPYEQIAEGGAGTEPVQMVQPAEGEAGTEPAQMVQPAEGEVGIGPAQIEQIAEGEAGIESAQMSRQHKVWQRHNLPKLSRQPKVWQRYNLLKLSRQPKVWQRHNLPK
jgi:hypothetical protein